MQKAGAGRAEAEGNRRRTLAEVTAVKLEEIRGEPTNDAPRRR